MWILLDSPKMYREWIERRINNKRITWNLDAFVQNIVFLLNCFVFIRNERNIEFRLDSYLNMNFEFEIKYLLTFTYLYIITRKSNTHIAKE